MPIPPHSPVFSEAAEETGLSGGQYKLPGLRLQPAEPGITLGNLNIEKWESLFKSEVLPQYTGGEWTRKTVPFRSALNEWGPKGELRDPSWREEHQRGLLASLLNAIDHP